MGVAMHFEFATATRIIFGAGSLSEIGAIASGFGQQAFIVTGLAEDISRPILENLEKHGLSIVNFRVHGEPTIDLVQDALGTARSTRCDLVIGIGGGSAIDTGKAVSALLTNKGDILDYVEVIGRNQPLTEPAMPFIAIPSTAGTGSEVTKNAVLSSPKHQFKVSLRSSLMLPKIALVDPELTYSLPFDVTARTGMDALAQVIEPFVSIKANPLIDGICREGIFRAGRALQRACESGTDIQAREDMALTSLFGGMALANAGLGAIHGFAAPIGGMYKAPHGAVCARLLPIVMDVNVRALLKRNPDHIALGRYQEIARLLTGMENASLHDGIHWLEELCKSLKIPGLAAYGVEKKDYETLAVKAQLASSMKGNPIQLEHEELLDILERAMD
jgi:alcohol dehydrogenase class IV